MTPEEKREYDKIYRQQNRERIREYKKKYNEINKETIRENRKKYREDNKDIRKDINKQHCKKYSKTDKGQKSLTIRKWRHRGLIDNYDKVYERYEYTLFCDNCRCDLDQDNKSVKCMDHDHSTGLFRNILCKSCNTLRG